MPAAAPSPAAANAHAAAPSRGPHPPMFSGIDAGEHSDERHGDQPLGRGVDAHRDARDDERRDVPQRPRSTTPRPP